MKSQSTLSLVLKALALAMSAAVAVLGILGTATPQTQASLLAIGLLALSILAFQSQS